MVNLRTSGVVLSLSVLLGAAAGAIPPGIPAETRRLVVVNGGASPTVEELWSRLKAKGASLRGAVSVWEGMSLRLPLPVQILIASSRPEWLLPQAPWQQWEQPPQISVDELAPCLGSRGWWAELPEGQWVLTVEIRQRPPLEKIQRTILDQGVYGPSPLQVCRTNLKNLSTAMEMYLVDQGRLPEKLSDLAPTYLSSIPECPSAGRRTYLLRQLTGNQYRLDCGGDHHGLGPGNLCYESETGLRPDVTPAQLRVSILRPMPSGGYAIEGGPAWNIQDSQVVLASSRAALEAVQDCAAGKKPALQQPPDLEEGMVQIWTAQNSIWDSLAFSHRPGVGRLVVKLPPQHPYAAPVQPDLLTPSFVPGDWENAVTTDLARPLRAAMAIRPKYFASKSQRIYSQALEAFDGRVTLASPAGALSDWVLRLEEEQLAEDCQSQLNNLAVRIQEYRKKKGKFPERLQQLQENGYPGILCPTGERLPLSYRRQGKSYQLYCPGERHRAAGLGPDQPRAGGTFQSLGQPPALLVARVRDPQRARDWIRNWKLGEKAHWLVLDGPDSVLLWAWGEQAEALLQKAQECHRSGQHLLACPEYQQLSQQGAQKGEQQAFHLEMTRLSGVRSALQRTRWARTWMEWQAGKVSSDAHRFSTMLGATLWGPWLDISENLSLDGQCLGLRTPDGVEFRRQGGLPSGLIAMPVFAEQLDPLLDPPDPLLGCKSNMKNIATALEMYATDHKGHYPPRLQTLIPGNYLKVVPTCPEACEDTYSATYQVKTRPEAFSFCCGGQNHLPWPANFPGYHSEKGLLLPPEP